MPAPRPLFVVTALALMTAPIAADDAVGPRVSLAGTLTLPTTVAEV